MIKKLLGAGLITGSIILTGCSTTSDLFVSAVNGAYIVEVNGGLIQTIQKADLTESEQTRLFLAKSKFEDAVNDFKGYEQDPLKFANDIISLKIKWEILKDVYGQDIYNIADTHFNEYTLDEQQALKDAHASLLAIADQIDKLVLRLDYAEAASSIGQFSSTVAKLYFLKGV